MKAVSSSVLRLSNTVFLGNLGERGIGAHLTEYSSFYCDSCTFGNNTATNNAAVLYLENSNYALNNSIIYENYSVNLGSLIFQYGISQKSSIVNTHIYSNRIEDKYSIFVTYGICLLYTSDAADE